MVKVKHLENISQSKESILAAKISSFVLLYQTKLSNCCSKVCLEHFCSIEMYETGQIRFSSLDDFEGRKVELVKVPCPMITPTPPPPHRAWTLQGKHKNLFCPWVTALRVV